MLLGSLTLAVNLVPIDTGGLAGSVNNNDTGNQCKSWESCTTGVIGPALILVYKEIQLGSGAKSYMRKSFLIYEEMRKYFTKY